MTIDERLEALTHNLKLLSLETEKHDKQLTQLAPLVTEITQRTTRLLAKSERPAATMNGKRLTTND